MAEGARHRAVQERPGPRRAGIGATLRGLSSAGLRRGLVVRGSTGGPLAALGLYTVLILMMAHPLVGALDRAVPVSTQKRLENDALHSLWTIAWSTHALLTAPATVFHANNFYPEPYTLAYSEHYLGIVPIFAPLWAVSGDLIVAFNVYYLVTFVLTGLATFALVRAWTGSVAAALFAGLAFAFTPPRVAHHFHIQLLGIWWTPLTLLLLERFLRRPSAARAALAAASFVMQWLSSIYLGWLLTFALAVYLAAAALGERRLLAGRRLWLYGLPAIAVAGAVLVPSLLPYLAVSERWAFRWPLDELDSHSPSPVGFLSVSNANVVYGPIFEEALGEVGVEKQLFLGFSPVALAILGVVEAIRRRQRRPGRPRGRRWVALTFLTLGAISCLLVFGPYAGTSPRIPLPYLWLYEWVPGFAGMRNPGRFVFLVALALAMLSGLGVAALLERLPPGRPRWLAAGALLLVLTVELFSILPSEPVPSPDAQALAYLRQTAADGPIVELPISRDRGVAETPRMLASTAHWRPMVNGFSSFRPPTYEELASVLRSAEPPVVADTLGALGVRTVVVHLDELAPADRDRLASGEWREAGFAERLRTERTLIWTLDPRRVPDLTRDVQVEIRMSRPAAGELATVRLLLLTDAGRIFYDPVGGARPVRVEWLPLERDGVATRHDLAVPLPRVVVPKPQVRAEFSVPAPSRPGPYRMVVRTEHWVEERTVMVRPASGDD